MAAVRASRQGMNPPGPAVFLGEFVALIPVGEQDLRVVVAAQPAPPLLLACRNQGRAARERRRSLFVHSDGLVGVGVRLLLFHRTGTTAGARSGAPVTGPIRVGWSLAGRERAA
jgi:hypothetical protein